MTHNLPNGKTWRSLAESAYRAFDASLHGTTRASGTAFEELPPEEQVAWQAAVHQAFNVVEYNKCQDLTADELKERLTESRWFGWIPPQPYEG